MLPPETYLNGRKVRERYGISSMTLYRWQEDEELDFPEPLIINGRKLWAESALKTWERSKAASSRSSASSTGKRSA
ncbi:helix-turn-helix domain-containing protein [Microvirga sp. KLBC 81]|nr:helix-turn-helix domain-containing protein [Microvirga sp. KLBC 81]